MLSLLLLYIGLLPLYIGLNPIADNPVCALLSYALVFVSAALVLTFFTIPVTLSVFGGAGAWVKHVAVRSARWLFGAFGAGVLLYLGGGALPPVGGRESAGGLEQRLLDVARTYLRDARPAVVKLEAEAQTHSSSFMISGPPEPAANPLEPLARFFLENRYEGDYSAVLSARGVNPVSAIMARREQRRLARESAEQKTSTSLTGEQTSTSVQDHMLQTQLEEASRRVERASSPLAVKAWVYVTANGRTEGEAKRLAEAAAEVVKASLSSHREGRGPWATRLDPP